MHGRPSASLLWRTPPWLSGGCRWILYEQHRAHLQINHKITIKLPAPAYYQVCLAALLYGIMWGGRPHRCVFVRICTYIDCLLLFSLNDFVLSSANFCQFVVFLGAILGPPWGHLGASVWSSSVILGSSSAIWTILTHLGPSWVAQSILRNWQKIGRNLINFMLSFLQILCQFLASLGTILGPPWGHLGANVGSSWAISGSSSAILGHIQPSWAILGDLIDPKKLAENWQKPD